MHKKSSPLSWRNLKCSYTLASDLDLRGAIESFTIVRNAPKGFENQVPYVLALISLSNGKKITSEVADCKKVSIGMKVVPCLRRLYVDKDDGLIDYGIKFKLEK
ncbi:OB-fold domain-containing protein [Candidatus Woesearchaeota archaeon]|nr:OB-fold domain-containing protein [Candidatus Woesearchaeota archaeon]